MKEKFLKKRQMEQDAKTGKKQFSVKRKKEQKRCRAD